MARVVSNVDEGDCGFSVTRALYLELWVKLLRDRSSGISAIKWSSSPPQASAIVPSKRNGPDHGAAGSSGPLVSDIGPATPDGQGSQYTSIEFGKRCREAGVRPSMGSVGDAYDNAMAESFFATLECELLDRRRFKTQAEARIAVFEFIEGFYNPCRRHSSLGYLSPIKFECQFGERPSNPVHTSMLPCSPGQGAAWKCRSKPHRQRAGRP